MTTTTTIRDLTLGITGMTCGSCKRHVESALAGVPGVHEATVDLGRGTAHVRYDESAASPAALAEAVRRAGYGVDAAQQGATGKKVGGCGCGCR